ncbi:unnamed protein product, partial [Arabidopsis halleri]
MIQHNTLGKGGKKTLKKRLARKTMQAEICISPTFVLV